jgi:hypothetical protein
MAPARRVEECQDLLRLLSSLAAACSKVKHNTHKRQLLNGCILNYKGYFVFVLHFKKESVNCAESLAICRSQYG